MLTPRGTDEIQGGVLLGRPARPARAGRNGVDVTRAAVLLRLVPFAPAHFDELASWFSDERELVQWGGPRVSHPLDASQC